MLSYQEQKQLEAEQAGTPTHALAYVTGVYSNGLTLRFVGETAGTNKRYKYNKSASFAVGNLVKVTKVSGTYVVDYPI